MIKLYEGSDEYKIILTSGKELNLLVDELDELQGGFEAKAEDLEYEVEDLKYDIERLKEALAEAETENEELRIELKDKE